MNDYKPSDFTGDEDDGKSTRRKFIQFASLGSFSLGLGYLTLDESNDDYVCIHEQILMESDLGENASFDPGPEGYHRFRYDEEEDVWYVVNTEEGLGIEEREADTETINWMLENTGEDIGDVYEPGEVLEDCNIAEESYQP